MVSTNVRLLALTIALIVTIGLLTTVSSASTVNRGDIDFLVSRGIIASSADSDLRLGDYMTRVELAALTVRMAKLDIVAKSLIGHVKFIDVPPEHWASGYVVVAHDRQYVLPASPREFHPDIPVTWGDFITAIASVCELDVDDKRLLAQRLGYDVSDMAAKVTRGEAFDVCSRAFLLSRNDGTDLLSAKFNVDKITATVVDSEGEHITLSFDDTTTTVAVGQFVFIPDWPGIVVDIWISNDMIVAAKIAEVADIWIGYVAETEHAEGYLSMVLTDNSKHELVFGTPLVDCWRGSTISEQFAPRAGDMVALVIVNDDVVSAWIQPSSQPLVVLSVEESVALMSANGTSILVNPQETIAFAEFMWRRPVAPGDVVYMCPEGTCTYMSSQVVGRLDAVSWTGQMCNIGGTQLKTDDCLVFMPGSDFVARMTDLSPLELTDTRVKGTLGFGGELIYVGYDVTPSRQEVLIIEQIDGQADTIQLLNSKGRRTIYLGSVGYEPDILDLTSYNHDLMLLEEVPVNQETYLVSYDIDPLRQMIQDSDGLWRRYTDNTSIFYIDPNGVFPLHGDEVSAISPSLLAGYRLIDPAGGTVASLALGDTDEGYVVRAVRLNAVVAPAYFVDDITFGVIIDVNVVNDEPSIMLFINGQICVVPIGNAAIRARTGTHSGIVTDDAQWLHPGEVVRLEFDTGGAELLSVTEMQARPFGHVTADFRVESVDEDYRTITLRSVYYPDLSLELLVTSETLLLDTRGPLPRLASVAELEGAFVHIIADANDGVAWILVTINP